MRHLDDRQCQMTDAEVMTTALVATLYIGGNFEVARALLKQQPYIPNMLSRSRLNRRLHRVKPFFLTLFAVLAEHWQALNETAMYVVDRFRGGLRPAPHAVGPTPSRRGLLRLCSRQATTLLRAQDPPHGHNP